MLVSAVLGILFALLGSLCVVAGVVVAVTHRGNAAPAAFGADEITSLLKAFTAALKALKDLPPASQLVVLGLVLIGLGTWLLETRPF